jgi:hypothetical protein
MSSRLAYCLLLWTCRSAVSAVGTSTVGSLGFEVGVPRLVHKHKIHKQENHHTDRTAGRKGRIPQNKRGLGIETIILLWNIDVGKVYRLELQYSLLSFARIMLSTAPARWITCPTIIFDRFWISPDGSNPVYLCIPSRNVARPSTPIGYDRSTCWWCARGGKLMVR